MGKILYFDCFAGASGDMILGALLDAGLPLGELEGYSARLKAMTQGRAAWTMALSHYEQAPPQLQQKLATEFAAKRKQEDDE